MAQLLLWETNELFKLFRKINHKIYNALEAKADVIMSGVFGFVDLNKRTAANSVTQKMRRAMSHRSWYVTECITDEDVNLGVGRIGIGIFNTAPQPATDASGAIALFLAGEFTNLHELGKTANEQTDESFILDLYASKGPEVFSSLKGSFVIAVYDRRVAKLLIVTDRLAKYPVFYFHEAGLFIFAPEIKGIFCDQAVKKNLDLVAMAQYMRFQQTFGDRTFFEGVKRAPQATIMTYDLREQKLTCQRYWDYADIPYLPQISFDEAVEEAGRLFRKVVKQYSQGPLRAGVYLSGGLDSRVILGMMERKSVPTITYGHKDCRDVYYAQRVASSVGSSHHWFDFPDGNWVKEYADLHLELTEGIHSWIHMHGISTLAEARGLLDVNVSGWDGGTVMGDSDSIEPLQVSPVDDIAYRIRMFYIYNQVNTWPSMTEMEERFLYTDAMYKQLKGVAADSMFEELNKFLNYRHEVRGEFFFAANGIPNSQAAITFMRSHIESRFPFFDDDFFNFIYSLPVVHRQDKKLYRALLWKELPALALIPYDSDEFLPTSNKLIRNSHALYIRAKRRLRKHLLPSRRERFTLYADYENYLRTDLKDWAEGILFNDRLASRDIFNMDYVNCIFERHLSGLEEWTIGKIAPIMTYEMMLRKFYD